MSAIYLSLMLLLSAYAHAADRVVECEPQRVHDKRYWSFRIIDGRSCWYPGRPGKSKTELRWPSPSNEPVSEATRPEVTVTPVDLAAVPAIVPVEEPQLTESMLVTFGLQRLLEAEPPRGREPVVGPMKRTSVWPIWFLVSLVVAAVAVAALLPIMRSSRNG